MQSPFFRIESSEVTITNIRRASLVAVKVCQTSPVLEFPKSDMVVGRSKKVWIDRPRRDGRIPTQGVTGDEEATSSQASRATAGRSNGVVVFVQQPAAFDLAVHSLGKQQQFQARLSHDRRATLGHDPEALGSQDHFGDAHRPDRSYFHREDPFQATARVSRPPSRGLIDREGEVVHARFIPPRLRSRRCR